MNVKNHLEGNAKNTEVLRKQQKNHSSTINTRRDRSRDETFKGGKKVPLHPRIPTPLVDRVITRTALH